MTAGDGGSEEDSPATWALGRYSLSVMPGVNPSFPKAVVRIELYPGGEGAAVWIPECDEFLQSAVPLRWDGDGEEIDIFGAAEGLIAPEPPLSDFLPYVRMAVPHSACRRLPGVGFLADGSEQEFGMWFTNSCVRPSPESDYSCGSYLCTHGPDRPDC